MKGFAFRAFPKRIAQKTVAVILCAALVVGSLPAQAADERRLKFYFLHTKESLNIVYKRNGRYIPSALKRINHFLRDWRQEKATKIDPRLLDLVWSVYQELDTNEPIHVVSAYRSAQTNRMLRRRGRGVASKSQHINGKALDFFVPGVSLSKIRNTGLEMEVGGVGYYPGSGSPFVHLDTGSVRHWPRMTEKQLAKVFPRGDTTHIGRNGKRLKRYEEGMTRRQRMAEGEISPLTNTRRGGLFARIFNRNQEATALSTRGQSLSNADQAPDSTLKTAAAPLGIIPKQKPTASDPIDLLAGEIMMVDAAFASSPPPRPVPDELKLARQQLALNNSNVLSRRSVASVWSKLGDRRSTDITHLIAETNQGFGQTDPQSSDIAAAVMSALRANQASTTHTLAEPSAPGQPAQIPSSAAASLAAAILAPQTSSSLDIEYQTYANSLVTAYAPSAPVPNTRPPFRSALLEPAQVQQQASFSSTTNIDPDAVLQNTSIAAVIPPRNRPAPSTMGGYSGRAQLPRPQMGDLLPRNHNGMGLSFHTPGPLTLSAMCNPKTARGDEFAILAMPTPQKIPNVFSMPAHIIDNRFARGHIQKLRTDRFSGHAIVMMRVAQL